MNKKEGEGCSVRPPCFAPTAVILLSSVLRAVSFLHPFFLVTVTSFIPPYTFHTSLLHAEWAPSNKGGTRFVEALRYMLEGGGFDSRWGSLENFRSLNLSGRSTALELTQHVTEKSTRYISFGWGGDGNFATFLC
jgi:hypothetical protein